MVWILVISPLLACTLKYAPCRYHYSRSAPPIQTLRTKTARSNKIPRAIHVISYPEKQKQKQRTVSVFEREDRRNKEFLRRQFRWFRLHLLAIKSYVSLSFSLSLHMYVGGIFSWVVVRVRDCEVLMDLTRAPALAGRNP